MPDDMQARQNISKLEPTSSSTGGNKKQGAKSLESDLKKKKNMEMIDLR